MILNTGLSFVSDSSPSFLKATSFLEGVTHRAPLTDFTSEEIKATYFIVWLLKVLVCLCPFCV